MKVFKIVTNVSSEWNGNQFATLGKVYYKRGAAEKTLKDSKCAFYAERFEKVWVQEYDLTPVITKEHQEVIAWKDDSGYGAYKNGK